MAKGKKLWNPTAPEGASNPFDEIRTLKKDRYLTVDEIDGNTVRIVISPWPSVDSGNRLVFPARASGDGERLDDPSDSELILDGAAFHATVTRERTSRQQPAADRPLRVGDVFWFRPDPDWLPLDGSKLMGQIVDITYAARGEAKAAMAWAVTGSSQAPGDLITAGAELDDEVAEEAIDTGSAPEATDEPPRPSVPGSVASPSV
ncbi:MAG TPA: hypothetical protein VLA91_11670 [Acidimicrobiia bacterium]|nr:hypothetical protein [Acidimicrobiia bacterium]